ncbi:hypothetical protein KGF57_000198, partial [Candida theae]
FQLMLYLSKLPSRALMIIFNELNQHQVLELAPLHSRFAPIAKTRLYHQLYVYPSHPLDPKSGPTKGSDREFRYHKHFNTLKSNNYTIISMNTLEKYLNKMDKHQHIDRLEFVACHVILFECVLRHFQTIKYLEVTQKPFIGYKVYFGLYVDRFISRYLKISAINTIYIQSKECFRVFDNQSRVPKITIEMCDWSRGLEFVNELPCVTSLSIFLKAWSEIPKSKLKLQTLCIFKISKHSRPYNVDLNFNTIFLKQLFLQGECSPHFLFSSTDLQTTLPNLVLLGMYFEKYNESAVISTFSVFGHKSLRSLIIHTAKYNDSFANIICGFRRGFPLASINWWHTPLRGKDSSSEDLVQIYELMTVFSPSLQLDTIGLHFKPNDEVQFPEKEFEVTTEYDTKMVIKLIQYYSCQELSQIFNMTNPNPRDLPLEEIVGLW